MTASHSAAAIVPETQPGEGGFKEQGCCCKTVAQCTWSTAKAWKEKVNTFCLTYILLLYSRTNKAGWRPTEGMSRKLLEPAPGLHGGLWRAEPVALCRLGSSVINAEDANMAVKPEGCCQAVIRK